MSLTSAMPTNFQEISAVPSAGSNPSVLSIAIQPLNRSYGIYHCGKRDKTHNSGKGNQITIMPGRLVDQASDQVVVLPPDPLPKPRLGRESEKQVQAGTKTNLRVCRVPVLLRDGRI